MRSNAALKLVKQWEPAPIVRQQRIEVDAIHNDLRSDPYGKDMLLRFLSGERHGERERPNNVCPVSYRIDGDELVRFAMYKTENSKDHRVPVRFVLARRFGNFYVGNSSSIKRPDSKNQPLGRTLQIQEAIGQVIPMVPFEVLAENKLDIAKLEVLEFGGSEYLEIDNRNFFNKVTGKHETKTERRHFGGACLFGIDDARYLFDVDRQEVANRIFNPFLSRIKVIDRCDTIAQAYALLKPKEVYQAEARGLECPRHGEWFFIPVPLKPRGKPTEGSLNNGANASHHVTLWDDLTGMVSGTVRHRWGRTEHMDLKLKEGQWYTPVPNTAIESFKITGRVD